MSNCPWSDRTRTSLTRLSQAHSFVTDAIASLGERHENLQKKPSESPCVTLLQHFQKDFPDQQVTKRAAIYLNLPSNLLNLIYIRLMPRANFFQPKNSQSGVAKKKATVWLQYVGIECENLFSTFRAACGKKNSRKTRRSRLRKILFCVCLKIKPAFSKISRRL